MRVRYTTRYFDDHRWATIRIKLQTSFMTPTFAVLTTDTSKLRNFQHELFSWKPLRDDITGDTTICLTHQVLGVDREFFLWFWASHIGWNQITPITKGQSGKMPLPFAPSALNTGEVPFCGPHELRW